MAVRNSRSVMPAQEQTITTVRLDSDQFQILQRALLKIHFHDQVRFKLGLARQNIALFQHLAVQSVSEIMQGLDLAFFEDTAAGAATADLTIAWPLDAGIQGCLEQIDLARHRKSLASIGDGALEFRGLLLEEHGREVLRCRVRRILHDTLNDE